MAASIDGLITPLTSIEVKGAIYSAIGSAGVTTTNWKPGSVVRTIIAAVAIVLAALSSLAAMIARSGFLELSAGAWLTLVARYVYGVERHDASFGAGTVTVSNTGGGVYTLDPGDLIVRNARTKKTYTNLEAVSIGALQTGVVVAVSAQESGTASTAFPGEVTEFETPYNGLTCQNAVAIVAQDSEDDPALKQRCTDKLGSLSPFGPRDAYRYAAINATRPDGTLVGATKVRTFPDGSGGVTVYVAAGGDTISLADLPYVDAAIQQNAAPLAVTATTLPAVPLVTDVDYNAWYYNTSGYTEAQVKEKIGKALVAYFERQVIGGDVVESIGTLYGDGIAAAITAADPGLLIVHVQINTPIGNITMGIGHLPVLGQITHRVTQLKAPGQA